MGQCRTLLSGVYSGARDRDRREREGTSALRVSQQKSRRAQSRQKGCLQGALKPLSWAAATLHSPPPTPTRGPCPGSQVPTASPTCSDLTLPIQTLAPSANTNRETYLHCLTKVNSPAHAWSLPSPTKVRLLGQRYVQGDFFQGLFPAGKTSRFRKFQWNSFLISVET